MVDWCLRFHKKSRLIGGSVVRDKLGERKEFVMKNILRVLTAGLLVTGFTNWANAAATVTISDGIDPILTFIDNGPGDGTADPGILTVHATLGSWNLILNTAVTKPAFGSATSPVMNLFIQADSTVAGSLEIKFSDDSFGPVSSPLSANVDGFVITGAATTVSYDVYADNGNVINGTGTHVASVPTSLLPVNTTTTGSLVIPGTGSLTEDINLVASGSSFDNINASLVVPEPSVLALGSLGVAALALGKRFRKRS
jgi:hypothetical protein